VWRPTKQGTEPFDTDRRKVGDIIDALRGDHHLSSDIVPPAWLGDAPADLPAGEIIACRNTAVHMASRTEIPHTPDLFAINPLDFDFDRQAQCPAWLAFLTQVLPDQQTIEQLRQTMGYLLTGDTSRQKAFLLIGPPRGGKGTIGRIIEALVGPRNTVSPGIASLGATFGLEPLVGKRLALFSDVRLGRRTEQGPIVEFLLRVTGQDTITIARKFLPAVTAHWPLRVLMLANELPPFFDPAGALISRFQIYQCPNSFLGQEDLDLSDKLKAELPGILNWSLDGLDALNATRHFVQPATAAQSLRHWQDAARPLNAFLREECIVRRPQANDDMQIERSTLFAAWAIWKENNKMGGPANRIEFGRQLHREARGITETRGAARLIDGLRPLLYQGVRLKTDAERAAATAEDI
jgi:putative DNA primase/helicase